MKFDAILFDLDGTLIDSGEGVFNSVEYALKKFGIEVKDKTKLRCFIGPPLTVSFKTFYGFDDENADRGVVYYREYYFCNILVHLLPINLTMLLM